jgi:DNA repair exonuclease SbcCD ATPase subunit
MEPLTIRIREDTKKSLEGEADEYDVSVSEYIRQLIEKGREYEELQERHQDELQAKEDRIEELQDRLADREDRIEELEGQLTRRSQIEDKIEDLPDKIRERETYQEQRQRMLDQATITQRLKWKVMGVPVDDADDTS